MVRVEKRRWMGPGGPRGLQSRCEARRTSRVRSIRMHLRHGNDTAAPLWTRPFFVWWLFRFVGRIVVRFGSTPPSEVFAFGQFFPEHPSSDVENGKTCSIFSPSSRRMRIPHHFAELWTRRMSRTPQKKPHKSGVATHEAVICSASRSQQCKPQLAVQAAVHRKKRCAVKDRSQESSRSKSLCVSCASRFHATGPTRCRSGTDAATGAFAGRHRGG